MTSFRVFQSNPLWTLPRHFIASDLYFIYMYTIPKFYLKLITLLKAMINSFRDKMSSPDHKGLTSWIHENVQFISNQFNCHVKWSLATVHCLPRLRQTNSFATSGATLLWSLYGYRTGIGVNDETTTAKRGRNYSPPLVSIRLISSSISTVRVIVNRVV